MPSRSWTRSAWATRAGRCATSILTNEARRPLEAYLRHGGRDRESAYVFTSRRGGRPGEAGIHHWSRTLKARATKDQWPLIAPITFRDLRHDFAQRAREAGWTLEGVAYQGSDKQWNRKSG